MPNWCSNTLQVRGPFDERQRLERECCRDDGSLSLELVAPLPDLSHLERDAWHTQRTALWGTKWDLDSCERRDAGDDLIFDFCTAWSPPTAALHHLSWRYPQLEFVLSYAEGGSDFAGQDEFRGGSVTRSREGTWAEVTVADPDDPDCRYFDDLLERCCARLDETPRDDVGHVLGDYGKLRGLLDPGTVDAVTLWRMLINAMAVPRGDALLLAARTSSNGEVAAAATLTCTLWPVLRPAHADTGGRVGERACETFRRTMERWTGPARTAGLLDAFCATVATLADGWSGDSADDLLTAAWKLTVGGTDPTGGRPGPT